MYQKGVIPVVFLLLCQLSLAQDSLKVRELEEVEVIADPLDIYSAGSKVRTQKLEGSYANLSNFLLQETPIYLRELGAPGQASSISFRGTGAGHSAVFWNGININSLTLGQTDFSLVPAVSFDEISLMYGSGAALLGTDAVGGSIHLSTRSPWITGHSLEFGTEFGSFANTGFNLGYRFGNENWQHSTRAYFGKSDNNFDVDYRNSTYEQNNAAFENFGFLHKTEYRIDPNNSVSLDLWYNQMDRELQPKLGDFNNDDQLMDESLRAILNYYTLLGGINLNLRAGYVYDHQVYNLDSETGTSRWILAAEMDKSLSTDLRIHAGINFRAMETNVDSYNEDIDENRTDLFLSMTYTPIPKLEITGNLRQTLVTGFSAPLAPSIGADLDLLETKNQTLSLRGIVSQTYKVPTFNDRFWDPGGNPDLNAEKGWTWEAGADHSVGKDKAKLTSSLGYYEMYINDWILWIPQGSIWSPDNVRSVEIRGMEWDENLQLTLGKTQVDVGGQLAWVQSINVNGVQENDDTDGKQLSYTPEWNFSNYIKISRGPVGVSLTNRFVGERFTELSNSSPPLDSFYLMDLGMNYQWKWKIIQGSLRFDIRNFLDVDYQNFINRGMPGRNYNLGIHLQLNRIKNDE